MEAFLISPLPGILVPFRTQELCESRGGRPGLPALIVFTVSVDVHSSGAV